MSILSLLSLLSLMLALAPLAFLTCCCQESCTIATSDFTGSDGDPPSGFTVQTGTAAINTNKLRMTASDTLVTCDTVDSSDADVIVIASVSGASNGDEIKLIVKYKDSANYIYGLYVPAATSAASVMKIIKRVANVETVLGARNNIVGGATSLNMCLSDGMITFSSAQFGGVGLTVFYAPEVSGQTACAMAVGSIASSVSFDNFSFFHQEPSHHGSFCNFCYVYCLQCWGSGATNDVADYQVDIASGPYTGTYILPFLTGDDLGALRQPCEWKLNLSPHMDPGGPCDLGSVFLFFYDNLSNAEPMGLTLWFNGGGAGGYPGMVEWTDLTGDPANCEPRTLTPTFVDAACPDNSNDDATLTPLQF